MEARRVVHAVEPSTVVRSTVVPAPDAPEGPSAEAIDFVRFCYRRRPVGWPELYDEMCAVAGRGAFQGWGIAELAEHGIGFTLSDMPVLAAIAAVVSREERERRRGSSTSVLTSTSD